MLTLVVDTSTHHGTIALCDNGVVLNESSWEKTESHSETLIAQMDTLFKQCHLDIKSTKQIICGIGPGSFTGIRVTLSFVRTLAHGLNIPIIAVDDCWAIALNYENSCENSSEHVTATSISVVLDAQKNMVFYGNYIWEKNFLKTLHPVSLISIKDLDLFLEKKSNWITNIPEIFSLKNISLLSSPAFPNAKSIYSHIYAHPKKHEQIQWQQLAPLYLRVSAAEEVLAAKKNNA